MMKPVSFAAELFPVAEHGRRVNLTVVRFTQEKGAASSFYKVVDTLQTVLEKRNVIIGDKKKAKKLVKLLD
jgi:serine/threonine-protein kinase HSL1 (negative regulator of Swe1 kinase)